MQTLRIPKSAVTAILLATSVLSLPSWSSSYGVMDPTFTPGLISDGQCGLFLSVLSDRSVLVEAKLGGGVTRVKADGSIDASWGNAGVASLPLYSMGLIPLGNGETLVISDAVWKLTSTGHLDSTFGLLSGSTDPLLGGFDFSAAVWPDSASLQPDGSVVLAIHDNSKGPTQSQFVFTRFDRRGLRDFSFGRGGFVHIPIGQLDLNTEYVFAWSLQPDGNIDIGTFAMGSNREIVPRLRRFSPDGIALSSFQPQGRLVPVQGIANWMAAFAKVDPYGRLVTVASVSVTGAETSISRYGVDGKADLEFGDRGQSFASVYPASHRENAVEYPMVVYLGPNGTWTVFDWSGQGTGYHVNQSTRVLRFTPSGLLDPAFEQGASISEGLDLPVEQTEGVHAAQLDDGAILTTLDTRKGCTLRKKRTDTLRAEAVMVEYYHAGLDQYFMTLDGTEAGILDNNPTMGWKRTGYRFGAWMPVDLPGATRVCRFYGDPVAGPNSHFYTSQGPECDGLRAIDAATPLGFPAWRFEGIVFSSAESANGACAGNLTPIYRAYNRGFERGLVPNHRYMADPRVYEEMQAKGWVGEGVRFCVPPIATRGAATRFP